MGHRFTLRKALLALGMLLGGAAVVLAQVPNFPQTLPPSTVVGRLPPNPGPTEAIPFSALFASGGFFALNVNKQNGTAYTIKLSDSGQMVTFNNASPVAVTLAAASAAGYKPFSFYATNAGAGLVTITPASGTISGASSFPITQGQGILVVSDETNWQVFAGVSGTATALTVGTTQLLSGTANGVLFDSGGVVGNLTPVNNGVLVTSSGGVPSISTTLPTAVQGNITSLGMIASGAWQGSVIAPAYLSVGTGAAKGILQGDASTLSISAGVISCTTATTSQIGCAKPDGTTITISGGVISATTVAGSVTVGTTGISSGTSNGLLYDNAGVIGNLATGNNLLMTTNGSGVPAMRAVGSTLTISAGTLGCTTATTSQIGCVEPDGTSITISGGVITSTASGSAGSVTIGTTTVTTGTDGYCLYDNAGVLGNKTCLTATGTGLANSGGTASLATIGTVSVLANVTGGSAIPSATTPANFSKAGFNGPMPCGWRLNMLMYPGRRDGSSTSTFKTLGGPANFLVCDGNTWGTASASSYAARGAMFVNSVGQDGTGDLTGLISINITSHDGAGCTSPCVSIVTNQGGLDPGDPAGAALAPNTHYNVYLVARDPSNAPNDWGLVFSSRSCNNGPSGTVQVVYPYFTCIDWFWSNGAANAMQWQTVKQDHLWNFAGNEPSSAMPIVGSGSTGGAWSALSGLSAPSINNGLSDSTGTFNLTAAVVTSGTYVHLAPNQFFGSYVPCGAAGVGVIYTYNSCIMTTDRGPPSFQSTDGSAFVFLFGGVDGF